MISPSSICFRELNCTGQSSLPSRSLCSFQATKATSSSFQFSFTIFLRLILNQIQNALTLFALCHKSFSLSDTHGRVLHKPPNQPFARLSSCTFTSDSSLFVINFLSYLFNSLQFELYFCFSFLSLICKQIVLHVIIEIDQFLFLFLLFVCWENWGKGKKISSFK